MTVLLCSRCHGSARMLRTARVTRDGKDKEKEEAIGSGADEEEVTDEDGLAAKSSAKSARSEGSASEEDDDIDK
jgi:hypothetical protein